MSESFYSPSILGLPMEFFHGLPFNVDEAVNFLSSSAGKELKYNLPSFPTQYLEFPSISVIETALEMIKQHELQEQVKSSEIHESTSENKETTIMTSTEKNNGLESDIDDPLDFNNSDLTGPRKLRKYDLSSVPVLCEPKIDHTSNVSGIHGLSGLRSYSELTDVFKDGHGTLEFFAKVVDHINISAATQSSLPVVIGVNSLASEMNYGARFSNLPSYAMDSQESSVNMCIVCGVSKSLCVHSFQNAFNGAHSNSTTPSMKLKSIEELISQSPHFN